MQNDKNGRNFVVFFRNNWELRNKCVFQNAIKKQRELSCVGNKNKRIMCVEKIKRPTKKKKMDF